MLGAVTARASAPTTGNQAYDVAVQIADGPDSTSATIRVKAGEDGAMRWNQAGQKWESVFNVTPSGSAALVKMTVTTAGGKVITPSMLLRHGVTGRVVDGDTGFKIGITVTPVAQGS